MGGREGFLNVYDGAMNNTTEAFPTLACLSCVFKLVGEQLIRSCFKYSHVGCFVSTLKDTPTGSRLAGTWLKRRSLSNDSQTLSIIFMVVELLGIFSLLESYL